MIEIRIEPDESYDVREAVVAAALEEPEARKLLAERDRVSDFLYAADTRYSELRDKRNPRAIHLIGAGGGSSRRAYVCYLCGAEVATESAKYPITLHAARDVLAHLERHLLQPKNEGARKR